MASFANVQYFIHADMVGGSEEVQNYADVIYGWSLVHLKKGFPLPRSVCSWIQTNKMGGSSGKPLTYFPFVESSSNFRFFSRTHILIRAFLLSYNKTVSFLCFRSQILKEKLNFFQERKNTYLFFINPIFYYFLFFSAILF